MRVVELQSQTLCPTRVGLIDQIGVHLFVKRKRGIFLRKVFGRQISISDFVEKKLLGRLQDTVNRLVEFEDTHSCLFVAS